MHSPQAKTTVAIACGGTGGHLFPGLAVAEHLRARGCAVTLLVSPKEVDQSAVKHVRDMSVVTLPAVGLTRHRVLRFGFGFFRSFLTSRRLFADERPAAVLAMGGFTSAPPVLAARHLGAATFLHESNSIPGRANRWLSRFVQQSFIGFPSAAARLRGSVSVTGTPVRSEFTGLTPDACRVRLGLDAADPVLLVVGGSQGASGINDLLASALPLLSQRWPDLQFLHVTGSADRGKVARAYAEAGLHAHVHAFLEDMPAALGGATAVVSRAGASSLAEIAAVQVPSVLVPFPAAVDNHQYHNARAFAETGAAVLLEQAGATPEALCAALGPLLADSARRGAIAAALRRWHTPAAAEHIAVTIFESISAGTRSALVRPGRSPGPLDQQHHSALA